MKKNSIMVKQVLMSALTAGIFTFGFTSCADEDVIQQKRLKVTVTSQVMMT